MDFKKKQKERPIGYNSNGAIYPENKGQMETKKSELKQKAIEWLSFQEGYNIECLLENEDFSACLIECMVEFTAKETTSQQQTIERLREVLSDIILLGEKEELDDEYVRVEFPNEVFEQAEQLLKTTEPIDQ